MRLGGTWSYPNFAGFLTEGLANKRRQEFSGCKGFSNVSKLFA
jgi:hypothetical protein